MRYIQPFYLENLFNFKRVWKTLKSYYTTLTIRPHTVTDQSARSKELWQISFIELLNFKYVTPLEHHLGEKIAQLLSQQTKG